jgi:YgiT-type zinc finger domain-containing protein
MVYEARPDTIQHKDRERAIEMLAWWCSQCGETIFEGQPLADRQRASFDLKAEVDAAERKAAVQEAADAVFERHAGAFKKLAE